jgi:hypothetical protein
MAHISAKTQSDIEPKKQGSISFLEQKKQKTFV